MSKFLTKNEIRAKVIASGVQNIVKAKTKSSFKLQDTLLVDFPEPDPEKSYLLYIHVPFCKTFCSYCSFYKVSYKYQLAKEYFDALQKDLKKAYQKGYKIHGIYIGGGTPTLVPELVAEIIDLAKSLFDIKEVSCEANPDIDDTIIALLKDRVDRLSIGVQSFQDTFLDRSKRLEKYGGSAQLKENVAKAIESFSIVNLDMIFNFFGQTKEEIVDDIEIIKKLKPHQIAYYPLMNSKYTKIEKLYGGYSQKDELAFYKIIMHLLRKEYKQVGSWSYSRKEGKFFDEYVVNNDEYLGLGAGAFSFVGNVLYANTFNVQEYISKIELKQSTVKQKKKYAKKERIQYRLMLKLFADDFDPYSFNKQYGKNSINFLKKELIALKLAGGFKKGGYSLTEHGKYFAMVMMKEFYIGMNELRARLQ